MQSLLLSLATSTSLAVVNLSLNDVSLNLTPDVALSLASSSQLTDFRFGSGLSSLSSLIVSFQNLFC